MPSLLLRFCKLGHCCPGPWKMTEICVAFALFCSRLQAPWQVGWRFDTWKTACSICLLGNQALHCKSRECRACAWCFWNFWFSCHIRGRTYTWIHACYPLERLELSVQQLLSPTSQIGSFLCKSMLIRVDYSLWIRYHESSLLNVIQSYLNHYWHFLGDCNMVVWNTSCFQSGLNESLNEASPAIDVHFPMIAGVNASSEKAVKEVC